METLANFILPIVYHLGKYQELHFTQNVVSLHFGAAGSFVDWQPFSWSVDGVLRIKRLANMWLPFVEFVLLLKTVINTKTIQPMSVVLRLCLPICRNLRKILGPTLKFGNKHWRVIVKIVQKFYKTYFYEITAIIPFIILFAIIFQMSDGSKNYYMIYLLTAIVLTPGCSSTVHIYTQTIHRTTQLKILVGRLTGIRTQIGQTKINDELRRDYRQLGRVLAVPRLCELYPGICLTTE